VCELTGVKPACAMKATAGILAPATDLSTERDLSLSIPVRTRKMVFGSSCHWAQDSRSPTISEVLPACQANMLARTLPCVRSPISNMTARCFASNVTFVKKIYKDGSTCQKCDFVWKQIEKDGLVDKINKITVADERDPQSEGIVLARKHNVSRAPFFVVTEDATPDEEKVYDVYFKLKKDVFAQETGEKEKNEEIIRGVMRHVF